MALVMGPLLGRIASVVTMMDIPGGRNRVAKEFYKRNPLHRDLSYSVFLDKSKKFNSYRQKI